MLGQDRKRRHARPTHHTVRTLCVGAGVATAGSALGGVARPAAASTVGDTAVALTAQEAGDPYIYGAAGPTSFDCSGLVMYVYAKLGISLPHNAQMQYDVMAHVPQSAAIPGDIIFFHDSAGHIYHDGIYAGGGQFWAAPHTGAVVYRGPIYSSSYYVGRPGGGPAPAPAPAPVPSAAAPVAMASSTLQEGAVGPAVATLQRSLGIAADGQFGPATAAAVRAFQAAHGLAADGVVGTMTRAALAGAAPRPAAPAPAATAAATPAAMSSSGVLGLGATGPAVLALQHQLGTTADGDFGPQTLAAVVSFQRGAGLVPDGEVGPLTRTALSARAA